MKTIAVSDIQSKSDLPNNLEALQNFSWELVLLYTRLMEKYRKLCKMEFGKSSERILDGSAEQMQLEELLNGLTGTTEPQKPEQPKEETYTVPEHTVRKKHPGRNIIPEGVEKEIVVHDVTDAEKACPNCSNDMNILDVKKHITVERIPAQYKVVEHRYPVYGCSHCKETVVKSQPQILPISKGKAELGLLCFVVFSKYLYHLPLYRIQRQIFHESGIWFSRQTMVGWIRRIAGLLQRIYDEILKVYAMSRIKHADDTPIPVQRVQENREVRSGFMWAGVAVCDDPVAVFVYDDHRNSEAAQRLLKDSRQGDYLMADDCPSLNKAIKELKLLAMLCMAHCRRQFVDAVNSGWHADFGRKIIRKIGHLYRIERFADKKKFDVANRHAIRQKVSRRILDEIKKLLMDPGFVKLPNSAMSNAINYMLNNWDRVVRYLEAGDLPIDNNILERLIRTLVIGRNNWIKVGSENGAQWMAIIYTIFATCKLNDVNPHEYLPDILMRLVIRPEEQSVKDLLPAEWKKSRVKANDSKAMVNYPKN